MGAQERKISREGTEGGRRRRSGVESRAKKPSAATTTTRPQAQHRWITLLHINMAISQNIRHRQRYRERERERESEREREKDWRCFVFLSLPPTAKRRGEKKSESTARRRWGVTRIKPFLRLCMQYLNYFPSQIEKKKNRYGLLIF